MPFSVVTASASLRIHALIALQGASRFDLHTFYCLFNSLLRLLALSKIKLDLLTQWVRGPHMLNFLKYDVDHEQKKVRVERVLSENTTPCSEAERRVLKDHYKSHLTFIMVIFIVTEGITGMIWLVFHPVCNGMWWKRSVYRGF